MRVLTEKELSLLCSQIREELRNKLNSTTKLLLNELRDNVEKHQELFLVFIGYQKVSLKSLDLYYSPYLELKPHTLAVCHNSWKVSIPDKFKQEAEILKQEYVSWFEEVLDKSSFCWGKIITDKAEKRDSIYRFCSDYYRLTR